MADCLSMKCPKDKNNVTNKVQNYDELQKLFFHGFIILHLNISDEHKELKIGLNEDKLIFTEYNDIQERLQ